MTAWFTTPSGSFTACQPNYAHRPFLRTWLYGSKTPPMPGHPDWTVTAPSVAKKSPAAASGAAALELATRGAPH